MVQLRHQKAFDSDVHNEMLVKLWSFGIQGSLLKWFRGYLTSRMQRVTIGSISAQLPVVFWSASRQYSWPTIVFNICE